MPGRGLAPAQQFLQARGGPRGRSAWVSRVAARSRTAAWRRAGRNVRRGGVGGGGGAAVWGGGGGGGWGRIAPSQRQAGPPAARRGVWRVRREYHGQLATPP